MDETTDWLETACAPLKVVPLSRSWPSADEIGIRAARRRRRRRIGLASSGTALVLVVALVVALVGTPRTGLESPQWLPAPRAEVRLAVGPDGSVHLLATATPMRPAGPTTSSELVAAEQAFALHLTRQELASAPGSNVLLSPMSADVDLSMLELGAGGATEKEIATALSSRALSAVQNAAAWKSLVSSEIAAASAGELTLANSLWLEHHVHVQATFLQQEAAAFGDDTYQVDFASPSATNAINDWVGHHTAGRIPALFTQGELQPTTLVVLANALHLHAAWANPHQFVATTGSFVTSGGASVSVPTLTAIDDLLRSSVTPTYQAVQIPYTNGRFAALVIEPQPGTMTSWLAGLSAKDLGAIVGSLTRGLVDLSMPALDLSSHPTLMTALSAMGMAGVFQSADLTPMLGPALGHRVYVDHVKQVSTLQVTSWGTDAAAATGISAVPVSTPAQPVRVIHIDHPYLFLVRDTATGAIMFSSVVNYPGGA